MLILIGILVIVGTAIITLQKDNKNLRGLAIGLLVIALILFLLK